jgi:5-formyltetrahydrofolate cyclo-ligase
VIGAEKAGLRARIRALLAAVPAGERTVRSAAACGRIEGWAPFRAARCVMLFLSLPDEIDTSVLVDAAFAAGKRVVVPRVERQARAIVPIAIRGLGDTAPRTLGIREPSNGPAVDLGEIDVVVVPGLAFDRRGARLGHGAGYYDRLFAGRDAPPPLRVALGYAFQVVERVPETPADRRVHAVATEDELTDCTG